MDLLKQLKDIKPNETIIDYQFYIFVALCVIAVLAVLFFIYRLLKRKKTNPYLVKLKNLDYGNSKKTAYEFTEYAKYFLNDENKERYAELVKELEKYKYKLVVDEMDRQTIEKIKKFIEDIK
jgi:type IV secretory pathway component VirB8